MEAEAGVAQVIAEWTAIARAHRAEWWHPLALVALLPVAVLLVVALS